MACFLHHFYKYADHELRLISIEGWHFCTRERHLWQPNNSNYSLVHLLFSCLCRTHSRRRKTGFQDARILLNTILLDNFVQHRYTYSSSSHDLRCTGKWIAITNIVFQNSVEIQQDISNLRKHWPRREKWTSLSRVVFACFASFWTEATNSFATGHHITTECASLALCSTVSHQSELNLRPSRLLELT